MPVENAPRYGTKYGGCESSFHTSAVLVTPPTWSAVPWPANPACSRYIRIGIDAGTGDRPLPWSESELKLNRN